MANAATLTLRALSEASAGDSGEAIDLGETRTACKLSLVVSDLGSGGSLTATLETSPDGTDGWRAVAQLDIIQERKRVHRAFLELERYARIVWIQTGGACTFGCDVEAHTVYASREDINSDGAGVVIQRAEAKDRDAVAKQVIKASSVAESFIMAAHGLPLSQWPDVVRTHVAAIATFYLAKLGAFQGAGADQFIIDAKVDAMKWFEGVAKRTNHIAGMTPKANPQVRLTSGNAESPTCYPPKFSDDWGDF